MRGKSLSHSTNVYVIGRYAAIGLGAVAFVFAASSVFGDSAGKSAAGDSQNIEIQGRFHQVSTPQIANLNEDCEAELTAYAAAIVALEAAMDAADDAYEHLYNCQRHVDEEELPVGGPGASARLRWQAEQMASTKSILER